MGFADERPFSYREKPMGPVTGESWEIATIVLQKMGIQRIDPIQTEFWSLIPKLLNYTYDMIASGFYITPTRHREISFSCPTYKNQVGLVVRSGNPHNIRTFHDLIRHPFARIGVVFGSVASSHIRMYNIPPNRIIQFADGHDGIKGIQNQETDTFLSSSIAINQMILNLPTHHVEVVREFDGFTANGQPMVDYGAFGFRKDELELRNRFNTELRPFIGSESHLKLVHSFGFTRDELPGELPTSIIKLLE